MWYKWRIRWWGGVLENVPYIVPLPTSKEMWVTTVIFFNGLFHGRSPHFFFNLTTTSQIMFPYCCSPWLWRGPIRIQASESQKCSSATGLYNNNSRNSHMGVVTMLFTKYMALLFFRAVGKGGERTHFKKGEEKLCSS
jgi:hypothetical protein